jgi:hypothetical protein
MTGHRRSTRRTGSTTLRETYAPHHNPTRPVRPRHLVLAASVVVAGPAAPASAAGLTLTVDVGQVVRPATQVAAGGLYGVASDSQPTTDMLLPLNPTGFTQPPPGTTHLGNGATEPCCDALDVGHNVTRSGAQQFVRLPDIYPTFPYEWRGWDDWERKVTTMVDDRLAATDVTNIHGWELWNEADWTWDTAAAGSPPPPDGDTLAGAGTLRSVGTGGRRAVPPDSPRRQPSGAPTAPPPYRRPLNGRPGAPPPGRFRPASASAPGRRSPPSPRRRRRRPWPPWWESRRTPWP